MKKNQFKLFLVSPFGKAVMFTVFALLIWGLLGILAGTDNTVIAVVLAVLLGYFGWRALSRITSQMFLFMSFGGWAIYFVVKGFLSIIIGVFVAPFQISKMLTMAIAADAEEYADGQ